MEIHKACQDEKASASSEERSTPKVAISKLSGTEYTNTKVIEVRLTKENSLEQFVVRH